MYVATETFIDPTDGQLIEAGKTVVSDRAEVFRMYRHRFKRFRGDFGRTALASSDELERLGDVTHFLGAEVTIRHGGRRRRAEVTLGRPHWQLCEPEPWRLVR